MSAERWLPVVGYEGFYEISDRGRVKLLARIVYSKGRGPYVRRTAVTLARSLRDGYPQITLHKSGHLRNRPIHQLVLEAFVGPRPRGTCCCHNNGIRHDNRLENLRWDTYSANQADIKIHAQQKEAIASALYGSA